MAVRRISVVTLVALVVLGACGGSSETSRSTEAPNASESSESTPAPDASSSPSAQSTPETDEQRFPDIIDVQAAADGGTWTFNVTVSSPYDSPERYADAWRVVGPDGTEYGRRELAHDHADEQPFTRSQTGIVIPPDVDTVTIEGRDLENGWGGTTFELTLPGR
jgi:hypothetical protein